jgi:hypothetical protein
MSPAPTLPQYPGEQNSSRYPLSKYPPMFPPQLSPLPVAVFVSVSGCALVASQPVCVRVKMMHVTPLQTFQAVPWPVYNVVLELTSARIKSRTVAIAGVTECVSSSGQVLTGQKNGP